MSTESFEAPSSAKDSFGYSSPRPSSESHRFLRILVFLILAYAISWTIWYWATTLARDNLEVYLRVGSSILRLRVYTLAVIIANFGPGIAAIILTCIGGTKQVRRLLHRFSIWKIHPKWYLFALLGPTLPYGLAFLLVLVSGAQAQAVEPWYRPLRLFFLNLLLSPLWEEMGWRGYLLPRLQAILSGSTSSLWLGAVWGLWHLPFYLFINPIGRQPHVFFFWFVVAVLAMSILFTFLYNKTGGSLLLVTVLHAASNATTITLFGSLPESILPMFILSTIFLWVIALVVLAKVGANLGFLGDSRTQARSLSRV